MMAGMSTLTGPLTGPGALCWQVQGHPCTLVQGCPCWLVQGHGFPRWPAQGCLYWLTQGCLCLHWPARGCPHYLDQTQHAAITCFTFYGFIYISWFVIANCISVSIKIDYDYNHWWYKNNNNNNTCNNIITMRWQVILLLYTIVHLSGYNHLTIKNKQNYFLFVLTMKLITWHGLIDWLRAWSPIVTSFENLVSGCKCS